MVRAFTTCLIITWYSFPRMQTLLFCHTHELESCVRPKLPSWKRACAIIQTITTSRSSGNDAPRAASAHLSAGTVDHDDSCIAALGDSSRGIILQVWSQASSISNSQKLARKAHWRSTTDLLNQKPCG